MIVKSDSDRNRTGERQLEGLTANTNIAPSRIHISGPRRNRTCIAHQGATVLQTAWTPKSNRPKLLPSDAGGIRTRIHEGLSFAAVPVRVPRHALAVRVGLEPTNTEV